MKTVALALALLSTFFLLSACEGCRTAVKPKIGGETSAPSLRIYAITDLAGALEPCGCVKDQLGGMDHFAAWVESEKAVAPTTMVLSAGPTFFLEPTLKDEHKSQDLKKAETIADAFKRTGLAALSPGGNDLVAGEVVLRDLAARTGGTAFSDRQEPAKNFVVVERAGIKIGLIGATRGPKGDLAPPNAIKDADAAARNAGAQLVIALSSFGRGEAKRIADVAPDLTAVIVGSPASEGETNSPTPPLEQIGNVLIVEAGKHLTTVVTLDLTVRENSYVFANASGLPAPAQGSFFRYAIKEVRDSLGKDPVVTESMLAYYKNVNDHNRQAFQSRVPPPVKAGEASFVGVDACSTCHKEARAVWDKTAHSHAYPTLADVHKEYNLDCVSCHVTGYDLPGGSTVTHVDKLKNVQCENCHGPGSKHAANPSKISVPVATPKGETCLACHHPPHVNEFSVAEKLPLILGPGHGK